jgi:nitroreductase
VEKPAETSVPLNGLIRRRWSPVVFAPTPVPRETLTRLFEAARWAASSYNEQPWRFMLATRDDPAEYQKALGCLVESNQAWAKTAPVLVLTAVRKTFSRNNKPNVCAWHDLGAASASLTLQATELGLFVHQMAGIVADTVRSTYGVPEEFEPATGIALGFPYAEDPALLPENIRQRQLEPRTRKPLSEIVFTGGWGKASPYTGG